MTKQLEGIVEFAGYECVAYETTYPGEAGGSTAIYLVDAVDGEPVATATVNVEGVSETLPPSEALIKDYSENEGMMEALIRAGLVQDTGRRVPTGYVTVPVARLLYGRHETDLEEEE